MILQITHRRSGGSESTHYVRGEWGYFAWLMENENEAGTIAVHEVEGEPAGVAIWEPKIGASRHGEGENSGELGNQYFMPELQPASEAVGKNEQA